MWFSITSFYVVCSNPAWVGFTFHPLWNRWIKYQSVPVMDWTNISPSLLHSRLWTRLKNKLPFILHYKQFKPIRTREEFIRLLNSSSNRFLSSDSNLRLLRMLENIPEYVSRLSHLLSASLYISHPLFAFLSFALSMHLSFFCLSLSLTAFMFSASFSFVLFFFASLSPSLCRLITLSLSRSVFLCLSSISFSVPFHLSPLYALLFLLLFSLMFSPSFSWPHHSISLPFSLPFLSSPYLPVRNRIWITFSTTLLIMSLHSAGSLFIHCLLFVPWLTTHFSYVLRFIEVIQVGCFSPDNTQNRSRNTCLFIDIINAIVVVSIKTASWLNR